MSTYILMTKLNPEAIKDIGTIEENGKKWKIAVKEKCPDVKWICHYSILGPYDFISIYEAPNEEVASKVSLISMSLGATKAESWTAIPYNQFLKILRSL
ncbi:MAG: GYD domain-containing protein [Acidobacteriota bacterium]